MYIKSQINQISYVFGTIHILLLRKHLQGGGGLNNGNFSLFSEHEICLCSAGGGPKNRQLVTLINLKRLIIVCFPKEINAIYQIQSSYRSTNHAF